MFDIGWTELLLIGIVALIVVGPKDLPVMFRTLGQFTGKARRMAREFQKAMEDAADETGVKGIGKDLKSMTSARKLGLDKLQDAARSFNKWEPGKKPNGAGKPGAARPVTSGAGAPAGTGAKAASPAEPEATASPAEAGVGGKTEAEAGPTAPRPSGATEAASPEAGPTEPGRS